MKVFKKVVIIIFFFGNISHHQAQQFESIGPALELGYNSGFNIKAGISISNSIVDRSTDAGNYYGLILYYRYNAIRSEHFQGPSLNAYYVFANYFHFGFNSTYFLQNGTDKTQFVLEPEIGLTAWSFFNIKFTYNISETDDFFRSSYQNWGITLGVNLLAFEL